MQGPTLLELVDNRHGDPKKNGHGQDLPLPRPKLEILEKYSGMTIIEWEKKLRIPVFSGFEAARDEMDDESGKLSFFTLDHDKHATAPRTWINTHNCMGVLCLRDKPSGVAIQIEIGSRFDANKSEGGRPFFLTYLLSKVFGGLLVDSVALGRDSLWDLLLAFVFRRRFMEAITVGMFREYHTSNHNDARIRGRIDVNEHLRRNIPFRGTVAYATHEITFDNPTNHLIRHALELVRRKWPGCLMGDHRLTEAEHQLEQGTPTWQQAGVLACIRRRENQTPIKHPYFAARYEPLRQVSLALLRNEGASLYQQTQEAEGVIFDGSWLWEEYVWTSLREIDGFEHPRNREQTGRWSTPPGVTFYPDFFHRSKRVVLDAKYQRPLADQNRERKKQIAKQVFTYMFLLDAVHGGLINPERNDGNRPAEITRQAGEKAKWHDLALEPPQDETSAMAFRSEMKKREEAFKEEVRKILG
jgi:hypothetical protein